MKLCIHYIVLQRMRSASTFLSSIVFACIFHLSLVFRFYLAIREEASQRLTDGSGNRPYYRY